MEIFKEFGNLEKIWKFGKSLEIWKKFGNLDKNWKFDENFGKKLNWEKIGYWEI